MAGQIGYVKCWNPRHEVEEAKFNVKDKTVNKPRKHCIFPERGPFYTCFDSRLVIEPDTSWLGPIKDKPIYDVNGTEVAEGGSCYPGRLAAELGADDSIFF